MMQLAAIAAGGAIGALLRFWTSNSVHAVFGRAFPYGTLTANVAGSLVMGILYVYFVDRAALAPEWRAAILIGLLGAFTTFSTFSIETFNLIEQGDVFKAALNVLLSVGLCLLATAFGVVIGRQI